MPEKHHFFYKIRNPKIVAKTPDIQRISGVLVGEGGFEPPKSLTTDLQSAPFGHSGIPPYSVCCAAERLELVDGLEPPTC